MIYLDNAATSFPKPGETLDALNGFVEAVGGNPGRSGHRLSLEAARIIFEAREKLTGFIHGTDSQRLIFTQNGTESLNLAILGLLREGDHVVTTSMEHNSVMRPLSFLKKARKVKVSLARCASDGTLDMGELKRSIRKNTKAVIVNHGSNVVGTVQPIRDIKDLIQDVPLIVDACQTAGSFPVNAEADGADILCFSCHKALFGIQGVGAMYLRAGLELTPLKFGGTGSKSESIEHPDVLPDRYECGTPNTPGIASLIGGLAFIEATGLGTIIQRKRLLRQRIVAGLKKIERVVVYGWDPDGSYIPVVSFNVAGMLASDVGYELNRKEIFVRVGLHCSPQAHKTIGTFPRGTVRASPGYFTTDGDIDTFLRVVEDIARR
jgi:cysteine desulfurase family protein